MQRRDILREKRSAKVIEALKNNEISIGHGLNQEMSLKRLGDTHWSFHYGALVNLIHMFSSVIDVIETIIEDDLDSDQRAEAKLTSPFPLKVLTPTTKNLNCSFE